MSDDTFRPTPRKRITSEDVGEPVGEHAVPEGDPMQRIRSMQEAVAAETGREVDMPPSAPFSNPDSPFQMMGNIPEGLKKAIQQQSSGPMAATPEGRVAKHRKPGADLRIKPGTGGGSEELESLLAKLADQNTWDEVELQIGRASCRERV